MTFWGVELKPEVPYLHADEDDMTTLHLSQATLGLQIHGPKRCVVKCKVGENPEVLLCSLVPGVQESCALDLLFDQDVTFTVVGPTSVHLTGYYMPMDYDSEDEDDIDSEEDGLEFGESDEDVSDLEGHASSVKIEEVKDVEAAKKAILASMNGEKNGKKRKKGDSAVKAGKGEDFMMGDESEDEDGLPKRAAVKETPTKKQAVAESGVTCCAGGVPTPGAATPTADTPTSQGKNKRNRKKNKQNQNGTETPTPTVDTPTSQGKMSKSQKKNKRKQMGTATPEAKANGGAAKTTTPTNTPKPAVK